MSLQCYSKYIVSSIYNSGQKYEMLCARKSAAYSSVCDRRKVLAMKKKKIWIVGFLIFLIGGIALWQLYHRIAKGSDSNLAERVIEIHLGAVQEDNISFQEGESIEDNRFLDWILEDLNIRVIYDWVYSKEEFERNINLHIECDALPDALVVNEEQYRKMLEYKQLQPLTDVYKTVVSDQVKAFVASGGEEIIASVTEDGEMMAIPFPNLTASGMNVMWIRQDWLDQLGLEVPRTMEEIEEVSRKFVEYEMGGEETIGILGPGIDDSLVAVGKCCFGLNPIFASYHAYPKYWLEDKQGNIVYGSVQREVRDALEKLADLYRQGLLDSEIFARTNTQEILDTGKVGILFGPWWAAEALESDMKENRSEWKAYGVPIDEEGVYTCQMPLSINQYLVIHKKCKNPDAIIQILNYGMTSRKQWSKEERLAGISMKTYPLGWESDFADELEYTYKVLKEVINGIEREIDFSNHKLLKQDIDNLKQLNHPPYEQFGIEDYEEGSRGFIRLYGILNGVAPIVEQDYVPIYNIFFGQTQTMKMKWKELEALENEVYAKIILGQEPIEAFDQFVEEWKENGGAVIEEEVRQLYMEK